MFPLLVFQLSKQQNRTRTTPSTVLETPPNRTRTKKFPLEELWGGLFSKFRDEKKNLGHGEKKIFNEKLPGRKFRTQFSIFSKENTLNSEEWPNLEKIFWMLWPKFSSSNQYWMDFENQFCKNRFQQSEPLWGQKPTSSNPSHSSLVSQPLAPPPPPLLRYRVWLYLSHLSFSGIAGYRAIPPQICPIAAEGIHRTLGLSPLGTVHETVLGHLQTHPKNLLRLLLTPKGYFNSSGQIR